MALEIGPVYSDTKTVTAASTPEALTTREIHCTSVFMLPLAANTNPVFVVDTLTPATRTTIPSAGMTLPIGDPRLISVDVTTNGEGVEWVAV